jgi:sugar phosphate isomerase/epimerase
LSRASIPGPPGPTRRQVLRLAVAASAAGVLAADRRAGGATAEGRAGCTLSIGTYSLKGMALDDAIALVAGIGYDGIEIAAQPGFDGEPSRLPATRREEIRRRLDGAGLTLSALMENLPPSPDDRQHRADVDRLGRVLDLARALATARPPLVQTVLGGGTWDEKKGLFRDRLADWLEAARRREVVLAIKPHRGGALSRPDEAIWLIRQLGDSPWLRLVYDYSHYAFRDLPLVDTAREALPYTAHLVVKDAVRQGDRVTFALPGEAGTVDYPTLLRTFYAGGYRGDVCCEVSAMITSRPGYDPASAARACYASMSRAFERAEVPRARGR